MFGSGFSWLWQVRRKAGAGHSWPGSGSLNGVVTVVAPIFLPLKHVYSPAVATSVANWLAGMAEWQVQQSDLHLFEGVDLNCHAHKHADHICHLVAPALLARFEDVARETWGACLGPAFHLEAHRFRPGDYVAPHTDATLNELRVVIMFPSFDVQGGDLIFHGECGATLAPRANEGAIFICSKESAHSVTRVQRGYRYSVCYRFEPTRTAHPSAGLHR